MTEYPEKSSLFLFFVIIILVSGCVSPSADNSPLQETVSRQSTFVSGAYNIDNQSSWIHINPIGDLYLDTPFGLTGTTNLNITGTTTFPAGSLLWVDLIEEERARNILSNVVIPVEKKSDGSNIFSYSYDMKGNYPAHYRVEIRKANQNFTTIARFNITSKETWWWIHINPIGETHEYQNLTITGTTNLPVGTEMSVSSRMEYHSCTQPPESGGRRSFCSGSCFGAIDPTKTRVMGGSDGRNIWTCPINTTDWCAYEYYWIRVESNWTNVTSEEVKIVFGRNPPIEYHNYG